MCVCVQLLAAVPVPRDIPLPLPADPFFLQAVLVLLFLAHIVFVNLMLGGLLIGMACELIGLRRPRFDALAHEIIATVTVNKSIAVVLGVGPLLAINVLYTVHFYTANALTGTAWIGIVPLVSAAFLLAYAHKYSWEKLAKRKGLHIALGLAAVGLLLVVPLIFLANINLMLFPQRWTQVRGFLTALPLPNVFPRYLHFLLACVSVCSLLLLAWFSRRGYPVEDRLPGWDRAGLRRLFYGIAFFSTFFQIFAGPLVYFTLPRQGVTLTLTVLVVAVAAMAMSLIGLLYWEFMFAGPRAGRLYVPIVGLLVVIGSTMGYVRHLYREGALGEHRQLMLAKTADFQYAVDAAGRRAELGIAAEAVLPVGQRIFRNQCAACHPITGLGSAPPVSEIAQLYAGNPAGIVTWAKNPGRKRTNFQPMPPMHFPDDQLRATAEYMLQIGANAASAPAQ